VLQALEADADAGIEIDMADALPELAPEAAAAALADLTRWLKSLPLSRRPLCKASPGEQKKNGGKKKPHPASLLRPLLSDSRPNKPRAPAHVPCAAHVVGSKG
jgi:hypothetical protein